MSAQGATRKTGSSPVRSAIIINHLRRLGADSLQLIVDNHPVVVRRERFKFQVPRRLVLRSACRALKGVSEVAVVVPLLSTNAVHIAANISSLPLHEQVRRLFG